jgi:MATE family multidrug resistance protein
VGQAFFAGGLVALSIVVGRIGTKELAAHQAVMNVLLTAYLPGLAFGLAAGALVGQALGRKDPEDARRWGWHVATVAFVVGAVSGLILGIRPDIVLAPFLTDPATRALGAMPMRVASVFLGLEAATLVINSALLGAGDSRTVLRVGVVMQWVVFLPYAVIAGPVLGGGLLVVWLGQVGQRLVTGYLLARRWEAEAWTKIKV